MLAAITSALPAYSSLPQQQRPSTRRLGLRTAGLDRVQFAAEKTSPKPVVFVLFTGLEDAQDRVTQTLREGLIRRGIQEKHIVIIPNPYTQKEPLGPFRVDSLNALLNSMEEHLRGAVRRVTHFEAARDPQSAFSKEVYEAVRQKLAQKGIHPGDVTLRCVGFSAGGQLAGTMAQLLKQQGYTVDRVVTLGTPHYHAVDPKQPTDHVVCRNDPEHQVFGPAVSMMGFSGHIGDQETNHTLPGEHHHAYSDDPVTQGHVLDIVLDAPEGRTRFRQPDRRQDPADPIRKGVRALGRFLDEFFGKG